MTLEKHYFVKNSNATGEGEAYINSNKSTNQVMILSIVKGNEDSSATSATVTFKGKLIESEDMVSLKAIRATDYAFVDNCGLNEVAYLDIIGYSQIQISVSDTDGEISVIGEVID